MPVMLTPFTTALISSRKSVRNRKGSGESFATRAISPVIRIWHAIMRPFSSSIPHPRLLAARRARYGRHRSRIQPCSKDRPEIARDREPFGAGAGPARLLRQTFPIVWDSQSLVFVQGKRADIISAMLGTSFEPRAAMSRSRTIRWALLIVAIAALGYLGWQRFQGGDHQAQAEAQKRVPARAAVPVRITAVEKADFPVYLTGLGTVQGFNTV